MPEIRHLNRAPIMEAIIGIEFSETLPTDFVGVISQLPRDIAERYPVREPIIQGTFSVDIPSNSATTSREELGYFFKSVDGLHVFRATRNGFALSRLQPYDTWESFRDEARGLWHFYRGCAGVSVPAVYTVRYINKIHVPSGVPLEGILSVYPNVPDSFPRIHGSWLRLLFPLTEQAGEVIVQQFRLPDEKPEFATIALDIEIRVPCTGYTNDQIWAGVESLRHLKNKYFFDALTEDFLRTLE